MLAVDRAGMLDVTAESRLRSEPNIFWQIRLRGGINVLN
jgi:hypothetical protein